MRRSCPDWNKPAGIAGWWAAATAIALLFGAAPAAAAPRHVPPEPSAPVVRTIEAPVHDWTAEAVHMGVAASAGAALAASATAARLRRRRPPRGAGDIDITELVQARRMPVPAGSRGPAWPHGKPER